MSRHLYYSLEALFNGVKEQEIEYTIYAELKDLSQLDKAPEREEHEQWKLPLKKDGPVRARLRLVNDRRWTMTTKAKRDGVDGFEEVNQEISQDLFNQLKEMATDGYKKIRYTFPIANTGRKWEIDVFMDKMGKPHPWVKIDLEVKDKREPIPNIHLDVGEFIVASDKNTPEEERFINSLWEKEWLKLDETLPNNNHS